MRLHNYFRSSSSFRVRIALALKGVAYAYVAVHIARGEHKKPPFVDLSADTLVPLLEVDGHQLSQSVACEIHPINNLRVIKHVTAGMNDAGESAAARTAWFQKWAREGMQAFERQLAFSDHQRAADGLPPSTFCYGNSPTLADLCLVPQVFNNRRFDVSLSGLPRCEAAFDARMALPAFQAAQPSACPDFEP